MKLIEEHLDQVQALCNTHMVDELYVFGSITSDAFNRNSDIDFLVQFTVSNPLEYFDNFMDFKDNLEKILDRKVDLTEIQTLKNPFLIRSIDRDKIKIYGRKDSKIVV